MISRPMEVKLYAGNLPYDTTQDELRDLFNQAGTVTAIEIVTDPESGKPKGYAFITMESQAEAAKAISLLNGKTINGRPVKINLARIRDERHDREGYWSGPTHRSRGGSTNRH